MGSDLYQTAAVGAAALQGFDRKCESGFKETPNDALVNGAGLYNVGSPSLTEAAEAAEDLERNMEFHNAMNAFHAIRYNLPRDKTLAKLDLDRAIGHAKFLLKRLQEQRAALVVKPVQTEIGDVAGESAADTSADAGGASVSI